MNLFEEVKQLFANKPNVGMTPRQVQIYLGYDPGDASIPQIVKVCQELTRKKKLVFLNRGHEKNSYMYMKR